MFSTARYSEMTVHCLDVAGHPEYNSCNWDDYGVLLRQVNDLYFLSYL